MKTNNYNGTTIMPVNHIHFDSPSEIVEQAKAGGLAEIASEKQGGGRRRTKFYEFPDWEHVENAHACGWPKGLEQVTKMAATLNVTSQCDNKAQIVSSPVGYAPNIPAYLQGRPDAMFAYHDQPDRQIVKILVNVAVSCGVSRDVITRRGATVLALNNAFESSGMNTEITLVWSSVGRGDSNNKFVVTTIAKRSGEYIEPDRLAFLLACPDFVRRVIFGALSHEPDFITLNFGFYRGGGYGRPCPAPQDMQDEADIYLPDLHYDRCPFDSAEKAFEWTTNELKKQGVRLS